MGGVFEEWGGGMGGVSEEWGGGMGGVSEEWEEWGGVSEEWESDDAFEDAFEDIALYTPHPPIPSAAKLANTTTKIQNGRILL